MWREWSEPSSTVTNDIAAAPASSACPSSATDDGRIAERLYSSSRTAIRSPSWTNPRIFDGFGEKYCLSRCSHGLQCSGNIQLLWFELNLTCDVPVVHDRANLLARLSFRWTVSSLQPRQVHKGITSTWPSERSKGTSRSSSVPLMIWTWFSLEDFQFNAAQWCHQVCRSVICVLSILTWPHYLSLRREHGPSILVPILTRTHPSTCYIGFDICAQSCVPTGNVPSRPVLALPKSTSQPDILLRPVKRRLLDLLVEKKRFVIYIMCLPRNAQSR